MKYRLLKDLPGCKAGAVFERLNDDIIRWNSGTVSRHETSSYIPSLVISHINNPDWFEEIKEPSRWRADNREPYWTFTAKDDYFDSQMWIEVGSEANLFHHNTGNYFKTREQAEKVAEAIKAILEYVNCPKSHAENELDHRHGFRVEVHEARKAVQS